MASPQEIRRREEARKKQGAAEEQKARQSPLRSTGGGVASGQGREQAPIALPEDEPVSAESLGGALDTGGPPIQFDMQGRRIPGPQSMAPTFGDILTGTPADDLVRIVRQDRLARRATETQEIPTFGEVAASTRNMQAQQQAAMQAASPEVQAQQVANVASSIRFLVDTKTGEFEPVMPEQPDPPVGPSEILFTVNPQDPTTPNILAQGRRVTPSDLARLGNAEKGIQPALRKGYQVPEQYAAIAQALGLG